MSGRMTAKKKMTKVWRERERERRKEKAKQKAPEKEGSGLSRREEGSSASPNKASVCERRC